MQEQFEELITYYLNNLNYNAKCGKKEALFLTDGTFES
jgi:hypothetical protein